MILENLIGPTAVIIALLLGLAVNITCTRRT